jgi:predicted nucleic acid-binding protein
VLRQLADAWTEVQPSEMLRGTAERLLAVHVLSAADAFQLAAALHWCQRQPMNRELVSFDARLRDAAYKEGFTILPAQIQ